MILAAALFWATSAGMVAQVVIVMAIFGPKVFAMQIVDRLVVIGGAPKCATTSLANMLSRNPGISVSQPKEPYYFGKDLQLARERGGVICHKDYLRCFVSPALDCETVCVDASTLYYSSRFAVEEICSASSGVKFIFCVRDPAEVLLSWHHHLQTFGAVSETMSLPRDLPDRGLTVPTSERNGTWDDLLYDYRRVIALGTQAKELVERVEPSRVLFVSYYSLVRSARHEYLNILKFVGVPDDGQTLLPRDNVASEFRHPVIRSVLMNRLVRQLAVEMKRQLPEPLIARFREARDRLARRPRLTDDRNELLVSLSSLDFVQSERVLLAEVMESVGAAVALE